MFKRKNINLESFRKRQAIKYSKACGDLSTLNVNKRC